MELSNSFPFLVLSVGLCICEMAITCVGVVIFGNSILLYVLILLPVVLAARCNDSVFPLLYCCVRDEALLRLHHEFVLLDAAPFNDCREWISSILLSLNYEQ